MSRLPVENLLKNDVFYILFFELQYCILQICILKLCNQDITITFIARTSNLFLVPRITPKSREKVCAQLSTLKPPPVAC